MEWMLAFLLLAGLFAIYDAIRKLNQNIVKQVDQNQRIIELLNELKRKQ
ncbi:hypothetical protein ABER61_13660 [Brevibacillus formosus]|uniref:Uncharacterized protein n=2 Tax=Brevibacillus formosus TaxID=54913 RepID=A0ABQ0T4H7_9BACL|nr:hypothetical protein [Brevibacillus formosus]MED1956211.1 hypothetical protein [Brevibacillus formosus]GED58216.1 hypothetical protein BFO01nite_23480 [Brevibacillus formosus]